VRKKKSCFRSSITASFSAAECKWKYFMRKSWAICSDGKTRLGLGESGDSTAMLARAIAILSVRPSVCPSVRPSCSGIESKRLNISCFLQHYGSSIIIVFPVLNNFGHSDWVTPLRRRRTGVLYEFRDFRPVSGCLWNATRGPQLL